jgi:hypothetical protein
MQGARLGANDGQETRTRTYLQFDHRDCRRHAAGAARQVRAKEKGVKATLLGKLEFFNPIASVKDRIGVAMIEAMEKTVALRRARPP